MATDLDILIIGAMLHDIGKFCQRAERPYSKEMEGEILPSYKGRYSHWHALYTDYFIEQELPLPEGLEHKRSQIARVAAAHHRPDADKILEMCNPQCLSGNWKIPGINANYPMIVNALSGFADSL